MRAVESNSTAEPRRPAQRPVARALNLRTACTEATLGSRWPPEPLPWGRRQQLFVLCFLPAWKDGGYRLGGVVACVLGQASSPSVGTLAGLPNPWGPGHGHRPRFFAGEWSERSGHWGMCWRLKPSGKAGLAPPRGPWEAEGTGKAGLVLFVGTGNNLDHSQSSHTPVVKAVLSI